MNYRLIVEGYGKIKYANINKKPLTLFVGDNNAGKSYLLSLIWALNSLSVDSALLRRIDTDEASSVYLEVHKKVCKYLMGSQINHTLELTLEKNELEILANEFMRMNKEEFISGIFNDTGVDIKTLKISLEDQMFIHVNCWHDLDGGWGYVWDNNRLKVGSKNLKDEDMIALADYLVRRIVRWILHSESGKTIYLPAARTGFMLAKDVINKVGRMETFDVMGQREEQAASLQAFTKPVINFLNTIEELPFEERENEKVVEYIENDIMHGEIRYSGLGKREVRYVPEGMPKSISLRTTSAVVTELAPLVLVMKHGRGIGEICYEEPEMCLHPGLQLKIARAIIKLVNNKVRVYATTHSDIILQHINNMCKAHDIGMTGSALERQSLQEDDLITPSDVSVYQLTDEGSYSTVQEVFYENGTFDVPTFRESLMDILSLTTDIQEYHQ